MCSISANLQLTRRSSVGILQRMPKPGSFASRSCTLSEHLRARPKHLRLPRKEPPAESIARFMARVVRILTAAKPRIDSLLPREGGGAAGKSTLRPRFNERSDVEATTRLASAAIPTHHLYEPFTPFGPPANHNPHQLDKPQFLHSKSSSFSLLLSYSPAIC